MDKFMRYDPTTTPILISTPILYPRHLFTILQFLFILVVAVIGRMCVCASVFACVHDIP